MNYIQENTKIEWSTSNGVSQKSEKLWDWWDYNVSLDAVKINKLVLTLDF